MTPEWACLALTIYFEARSEPIEAQREVANVVLERVEDRRWPDTICGVVLQGGEQLHLCQFSWYCDGKPDTPANRYAWNVAISVAYESMQSKNSVFSGATHYHAYYASPYWARELIYLGRVGDHLFYREDR